MRATSRRSAIRYSALRTLAASDRLPVPDSTVLYGLILTWLFWPSLAGYLFWQGQTKYAWIAAAAPVVLTGLIVAMDQVDPDIPMFLSLFIHGIVAARLVAEAFRVADD